jgi:hypothetical protein
VWCGLIGGKLIGPYFYDGTLTGRRYLDFLANQLPLLLENVPYNCFFFVARRIIDITAESTLPCSFFD